jgi:hypothetical protein
MEASVAQGSPFKPCGISRPLSPHAGLEDDPTCVINGTEWKSRRVTIRTLRYRLFKVFASYRRGPKVQMTGATEGVIRHHFVRGLCRGVKGMPVPAPTITKPAQKTGDA